MLSDPSTAFAGHYQGDLITVNEVETSVCVSDVSTSFRVEQHKLTKGKYLQEVAQHDGENENDVFM